MARVLVGIVSTWALAACTAARGPTAAERASSVPVTPRSDSVRDRAAPDSLAAVLVEVEREALALRAAQAEARARGEAVTATRALYGGELTPFLRDTHFDSPRLINPLSPPIDITTLGFDEHQVGFGLTLRVPIDISGDIRARVRSATAVHEAAIAGVQDVRLRLLLAAATLYRGIQANLGTRAALQRQADSLRAHLRVAEEAVRVQRLARVEALRIRADLDRVEGQLALLSGREAGLRARLAALLRRPAYDATVAPDAVPPTPLVSGSRAGETRPDIVVAWRGLEAAEAATRVAQAASHPQLSFDAALQKNSGYDGDSDTTGQFGFLLRWNFWDAGRRQARTREARYLAHVASLNLDRIRETAAAEVAAALAAWEAEQRRHAAALSSTEAARETARIQGRRFVDGRLSAADLVDAEAALAEAEAEVAVSLVQWWIADDTLRTALGQPPAAYPGEER